MKKIRKALALLLALCMIFTLVSCTGGDNTESQTPEQPSQGQDEQQPSNEPSQPDDEGPVMADSITLWTYPIGTWGDEATVKSLTDAFRGVPGLHRR